MKAGLENKAIVVKQISSSFYWNNQSIRLQSETPEVSHNEQTLDYCCL